ALNQIRTILEMRDHWGKDVTVGRIRAKAIDDWFASFPSWQGPTNPSIRVDFTTLRNGTVISASSALVNWSAGFLPGTGGIIFGSNKSDLTLHPGGFDGGQNTTEDYESIDDRIKGIQTL